MEINNDEIKFGKRCDPNTMACKDCKWAFLNGPTNCSCVKYKNKPDSVYFDNQPCPRYIKMIKSVK